MSKQAPRFSVVTVTYNNLNGLRRTAESVLAQNFADVEWLVIDGASKDGSVAYLQSLTHPSFVLVSEPDKGIFDAMQKGLTRSHGEYVCFMNAGDAFAAPDVLSRLDELIGTATPPLVYGDAIESDGIQEFYKPARAPEHNRLVMFTHHQAQLYRTKVARSLGGYDLSYLLSCDWVLTTRLLKQGKSLAAPFAVCVFERGGISQRADRRRLLDAELFRIYHEEQGHSLLTSSLLWIAKVGVNRIRSAFPRLYDVLRYRRGAPAQVA